MMNGRAVRSVLIRNNNNNRQENGSVDYVPRTIQFDESSEEYRCLCNCFHVKTGAFIIGGVHILMVLFFLVQCLFVFLEQNERAEGYKYVQISFWLAMAGLTLATISLLLLFLGLTRNVAPLLLPHLIMQCLAILIFLVVLICGTIALSTDSSVFYRVVNAVAFDEKPRQTTVAHGTSEKVWIYSMMTFYLTCFLLELLWFVRVIYSCYRYLEERSTYMKYCLAFSTPMKTLSAR